MNIFTATESYEKWLSRYMRLIPVDVQMKHDLMAESAFPFLRATFYRFMQLWEEGGAEVNDAPKVLAVGDLHIENFGTWRDLDGRLIWGVNDFDEAFSLPYCLDLVRLGVSAALAIKERHFSVSSDDAIDSILEGYQATLENGGELFVLEEHHRWLRKIAMSELREPAQFWKKFSKLPEARGRDATKAARVIKKFLPERGIKFRLVRRVAGLGSLGRPRVAALADWNGGMICREAKAMAPSACIWASGRKKNSQHTEMIARKALGVSDPFYHMNQGWLVRRLAPHCCKLEIGHLPKRRDEMELLIAMGSETANVHLGTGVARQLRSDFTKKRKKQIRRAVENMTEMVLEDWTRWRSR